MVGRHKTLFIPSLKPGESIMFRYHVGSKDLIEDIMITALKRMGLNNMDVTTLYKRAQMTRDEITRIYNETDFDGAVDYVVEQYNYHNGN